MFTARYEFRKCKRVNFRITGLKLYLVCCDIDKDK